MRTPKAPGTELVAVRPSDSERDQTVRTLRDFSVEGRLSPETFERRMELALTARTRTDLAGLVADLPRRRRLSQWFVDAVGSAASLRTRVAVAWRTPRLPGLMLPTGGTDLLRIGRDPANHVRVNDGTVSRYHAELRRHETGWMIIDLGSRNGSRVNGWHITSPTLVVPGDQVAFGAVKYRLG